MRVRAASGNGRVDMAVLFGIVAIVGIASWAIVKADELSGLGRAARRGSLRHPHGRLVATYCESLPEEASYRARLAGRMPVVTAVLAAAAAVAALAMEANGMVAGVVAADALMAGLAVVPVAGECVLRLPKPAQKFSSFVVIAFAGLVVATACSMAVAALGASGAGLVAVAARVLASVAGGVAGCALAAAAVREQVAFERRFEDGSESRIAVSPSSAAYKAYRALMADAKAWESGRPKD